MLSRRKSVVTGLVMVQNISQPDHHTEPQTNRSAINENKFHKQTAASLNRKRLE